MLHDAPFGEEAGLRRPPLTPPECDLRDFAFMPLDIMRLRDSDFASLSTGDEFRAAVLLWGAAWHQLPAGSMPADDRTLARLAGYGRDIDGWLSVKKAALHGFVECTDGRLYHPVVAEKALEAWIEKLALQKRSGAGHEKRWGITIDSALIEEQQEAARRMLLNLNPQSRTIRRRPPNSQPCPEEIGSKINSEGNPTGMPKAIHQESQPEATGNAAGMPEALPQPCQETGTGTGIDRKEERSSVANATGAVAPLDFPSGSPAPIDPRSRLFRNGLQILMDLTGKTEGAARTLIGKWLKAVNDDAKRVLRALEDARDARLADPVPWIEVALNGRQQVRSDDPAFMRARW